MRVTVQQLVALGPLPESTGATESELWAWESALQQVAPPLSDEEAQALLALFGPDECFRLARSLIHLVETAPGWPLREAIVGDNPWLQLLRDRADRGTGSGPEAR